MSISFLLALLGFQSCKTAVDNELAGVDLSQYSTLNADFSSDNFEVILLSEVLNYGIPHPIRLFYSVNKQVILEESRDENSGQFGYHYFKLDENAKVVDSIYVPLAGGHRTGFINEYMVHTNSNGDSDYTTWPLDGDKTPKKIAVVNGDLSWPDAKVAQQEDELIQKSDYYFYDVNYQPVTDGEGWSLQKLFYCLAGKWQVLYRRFDETIHLDERDKLNRYRQNFFLSSDDEMPNAIQNFSLKGYQKEEKLKYDHSIGGGSQSFSVKGWIGTGYFDIPLLDDTLKVKRPNLIVEEGTPGNPQKRYYLSNGKDQSVSPFHLNIFTDPGLTFALYSTGKYRVYAIRKKQSK